MRYMPAKKLASRSGHACGLARRWDLLEVFQSNVVFSRLRPGREGSAVLRVARQPTDKWSENQVLRSDSSPPAKQTFRRVTAAKCRTSKTRCSLV
jgi:hypothetical protein